jgi:lipid-A-disaccharide synthase
MTAYDLFLFAGEPSADLHGEALLKNLHAENKNIKIFGVAGPKMRAQGMDCIMEMERFQVMGFVDVFLALPRLMQQFYSIADLILTKNPKVALFIDYPGFNLRMEKYLRKKGFQGKLVHYICPSVWAWGKKRIPLMEKNLDLLLSIFPFEKEYFSSSFPVHYVGHPLVSRIQSYSHQTLSFPPHQTLVAVFPGSRKKEILLNFPIYLKVMKKLIEQTPGLLFGLSISQQAFLPLIEDCIEKESLQMGKDIVFVPSAHTYDLMKQCKMAIAKSGTVTLELALHHVPTVVTYGIAPLDLFIAQKVLRISLPFYCIVNIVAGKEVFKELIGPQLTEKSLYEEAYRLLHDASYRSACIQQCKKVEGILGPRNASQEAAKVLCNHFFCLSK